MAIFPGSVAPHDPNSVDLNNRLAKPDMEHPFGTDHHGRDILSRVIHGTQTSLVTALSVVAVGVVLGTFIGLTAGFFLEVLLIRPLCVLWISSWRFRGRSFP